MPSLGNLFFKITADTSQAASSLKRLEDQINASVRNVGSIGRVLGGALSAAGIAAGLLQIGKSAIIASTQFETAFLRIKNITGATTKDIEKYKSSLKGISSEVGQPIANLTAGLYAITSSGLKGAAALETLRIAAKASAVGMGETETIARTISATLNAYGKENISAAAAANIFFNTTKLGALDVAELAPAMGSVLGVASVLGIKLEQLGGFVASLSLQGINASEAVTSLRAIIDAMINPSVEAEKALKGVGLNMEYIRNIAKKDLSLALRTVSEAFNGNETAIAKVLGRKEAITGFLAVTGQNFQRYSEILKEVSTDTTSFDKASAEALNSTEAKWNKLTASIKNASLELGGALKFIITGLLTYSRFGSASKEVESSAARIKREYEEISKLMTNQLGYIKQFSRYGSLAQAIPLGVPAIGLPFAEKGGKKSGTTPTDADKKQLTVLQKLNEEREKVITRIQEAALAGRDYSKDLTALTAVTEKLAFAEQTRAEALAKISRKLEVSTLPQKAIKEVTSSTVDLNPKGNTDITGVEETTKKYTEFSSVLDEIGAQFEGIGTASADAFGLIAAQLLTGSLAFKDLGKAALSAAREIVQAALAASIASVIKWAISKLGLLGVGIAIAGIAVISSLFKSKVPKLAKGGLAFGPQLALVGDNPNAGRDPEVIAPLSRLQALLRTEVFKMTDVLATAFNQSLAAVQFNESISPSLLQNIELRPQASEINVVGRIDGTDIMLVVDRQAAFKKRQLGR